MFTSACRAGRLVELRVGSPFDEEQMKTLVEQHLETIRSVGGSFVVVTDLRGAHVFPPAVTQKFVGMMSQVNPLIERSGILIGDSAILGLQAERVIDEVGNSVRRVFHDPDELHTWVSELLSDAESRRLREFLAEGGTDAG